MVQGRSSSLRYASQGCQRSIYFRSWGTASVPDQSKKGPSITSAFENGIYGRSEKALSGYHRSSWWKPGAGRFMVGLLRIEEKHCVKITPQRTSVNSLSQR